MHDAGLRKAGIVSMVSAELTLSSLAALDEYYTDFSLRLHYFEDAGKTGACRSDTA
jgi:hypothetical protein